MNTKRPSSGFAKVFHSKRPSTTRPSSKDAKPSAVSQTKSYRHPTGSHPPHKHYPKMGSSELLPEFHEEVAKPQNIVEGEIENLSIHFMDIAEIYPDPIEVDTAKNLKELQGKVNSLSETEITYGTIYDRRMGPLDGMKECMTCYQHVGTCLFHPGLIKLPEEAYFVNPKALKYAYQVLKSVCNSCSRLKVTKEYLHDHRIDQIQNKEKRLEAITKKCNTQKGTPCLFNDIKADEARKMAQRTGITIAPTKDCTPNPHFFATGGKNYGDIRYAPNQSEVPLSMSITKVLQIFNAIPVGDLELMGFTSDSHPRNYIMRAILVIPPGVRMTVRGSGEIGDDPMEKGYNEIIKASELLKKMRNPDNVISSSSKKGKKREEKKTAPDLIEIIKTEFEKLINGEKSKNPNKYERKGLEDAMQGKMGFMRHMMMGKRVGSFGRTVGSTGADIRMQEVGVPRNFRDELTTENRVYDLNIEYLKRLIYQGEVILIDKYKNGKQDRYIVKSSNIEKIVANLHNGDIVHRRIRDSDSVLINRQPTIHKQSIMKHRVKFNDERTLQLSLPQVIGQKGDFDGDEFNMHVLQSYGGKANAAVLQDTTACLANEQNNSTMMYPTFEAPLNAFKLTRRDTPIAIGMFEEFLYQITPIVNMKDLRERLVWFRVPWLSGKALFSSMLPRDFSYTYGSGDEKVVIEMGVLKRGAITKKTLGPGSSITNAIRLEYGNSRAIDFIDSATIVLQLYGLVDPTSIGIKDCHHEIKEVLDLKVRKIYEAEVLSETPDYANQSEIERVKEEQSIVATTDNLKIEGAKEMMKNIPADNSFILIAMSGAKGNKENVYQILVSGGQNFYMGERMPTDYNGRSLPMFRENDTRLVARGLCVNSFSKGLTPEELFFLQKSGRKALSDTSQTTPIPGNIRRELATMLTDVVAEHDGSIRTSNKSIVQFTYNGDGFDAAKMHKVNFLGYKAPYFASINSLATSLTNKTRYRRRVRKKH